MATAQDPAFCMEYTLGPENGGPNREVFQGLYPAMRRWDCHANIFSTAAMVAMRDYWLGRNFLRELVIRTGGGYIVRNADGTAELDAEGNSVRARWPDVTTYLCTAGANWTTRAEGPEWDEAREFILSRRNAPTEGDPPVPDMQRMLEDPYPYSRFTVNPSMVLWRLAHRMPGQPNICRSIPVTVELSHTAEGYHNAAALGMPQAQFRPHYRVEHTELEKDWVNLSRRDCTRFLSMWRRADTGELIPEDEIDTYTGPTMCWHGTMGTPCYAPYPTQQPVKPTGKSPSKRKLGQASGGASGGRKAGKRGRVAGSPGKKRGKVKA